MLNLLNSMIDLVTQLIYNIISLYYEHFSTFLNFSMTKCHHNKTIFIPFDVDKDSTQESKKKI
jgi:hypothetical protein